MKHVFNFSLRSGDSPSLGKSIVVLVHKAGDVSRVENYHLVSLPCFLESVKVILHSETKNRSTVFFQRSLSRLA